jgi:hypothetical protein
MHPVPVVTPSANIRCPSGTKNGKSLLGIPDVGALFLNECEVMNLVKQKKQRGQK